MAITRRDLLRTSISTTLGFGLVGAVGPRLWAGSLTAWLPALVERLLAPWETGGHGEIEGLRRVNPEWDLLARMFTAMVVADRVLTGDLDVDRARAALVPMVRSGVERVTAEGPGGFLLPYWRRGAFLARRRSVFVDGELAVMAGVHRLLGGAGLDGVHRRLIEQVRAGLDAAPHGHAESYPQECWLFCNATAMVALRLHELVDGADHADARARFLAALPGLEDARGMLVSAYTPQAHVVQPAEGSSLFLASHSLLAVGPGVAATQYARAKAHLLGDVVGFGFAREWPGSGEVDIDSGTVVPLLGASPGGERPCPRGVSGPRRLGRSPGAPGVGPRGWHAPPPASRRGLCREQPRG